MEKKNETISDVLKEVAEFTCFGRISAERVKFIVSDISRRFKAAHDREVEELRNCLKQAIDDYFTNQCPHCMGCRSTLRCEFKGWKAVLERSLGVAYIPKNKNERNQ